MSSSGLNVVVVRGCLTREPEERVLPSGDRQVGLEISVRPANGKAESVPVVWAEAPAAALSWESSTEVVVVGRVRRRFFRAGGSTQSRTEVVADTVVPSRQAKKVAAAIERAVEALSP